jgi:hypothetical protein
MNAFRGRLRQVALAGGVYFACAAPAFAQSWPTDDALWSVRSNVPGWALLRGRGEREVTSAGPLGLRLFADATASSPGIEIPSFGGQTGVLARLDRRFASGWIGLGVERRPWFEHRIQLPVLEVGARARRGALTVAGRGRRSTFLVPTSPLFVTSWVSPPHFHSPPEIIPTVPYWEYRAPQLAAVISFETLIRLTRGAWQLEAMTGLAVGPAISPLRLANFQATRWTSRGIGFDLGVGSGVPGWYSDGRSPRPHLQLGMQFDPGGRVRTIGARGSPGSGSDPASLRIMRIAAGRYVLRVQAAHLGRVAIRGDFSGWDPISLHRAGGGWWEIELSLSPGAHEVELSLDGGAWQAPPGIASAEGEYGSRVGRFITD